MKQEQVVIQRIINSAKASKGWGWKELADEMNKIGIPISANNLAVKVSRGSIKASEFITVMKLLGNNFIDLSAIQIPKK